MSDLKKKRKQRERDDQLLFFHWKHSRFSYGKGFWTGVSIATRGQKSRSPVLAGNLSTRTTTDYKFRVRHCHTIEQGGGKDRDRERDVRSTPFTTDSRSAADCQPAGLVKVRTAHTGKHKHTYARKRQTLSLFDQPPPAFTATGGMSNPGL